MRTSSGGSADSIGKARFLRSDEQYWQQYPGRSGSPCPGCLWRSTASSLSARPFRKPGCHRSRSRKPGPSSRRPLVQDPAILARYHGCRSSCRASRRARITSQRADANLEETAVGVFLAHLFAQEFGPGTTRRDLFAAAPGPWNRQYQPPGASGRARLPVHKTRAAEPSGRGRAANFQPASGRQYAPPPANLHAAWANGSSPASAVAAAMMSRAATTLACAATVPTPPRSV